MTAPPQLLDRRMTGWRALLVWLVAASGAVAIVIAQIANPADWVVILIIGEVFVAFGVVGSVLVTRLPRNLVGWLMWGSGAALAWGAAGSAYAMHSAQACGGCEPLTAPIAVVANAAFAPVVGAVAVFIPLLFPTGRMPSPRWRPVAWLGIAATVLFTAAIAFAPGPISGGVDNPIGMEAFGREGIMAAVALTSMAAALVLALSSVVWRFRHARAVERQQLRWFAYAGLLMIIGLVVGVVVPFDGAWVVLFAGLGLMPLATGVAVLRYRLYDLDRLVSRTIAYAVVTGGLVLAYLAMNLALTEAFSSLSSGNTIVVAASTLVVAVLFTPLRRAVQRVVDRRFDRARYDAQVTTDRFAARVRDGVDLGVLSGDLVGTAVDAFRPMAADIWIRRAGTSMP